MNLPVIHRSAIVEPGAVIGAGAKVGPFCTVGAGVVLEDNVELVSHVAVAGRTTIGAGAKLFPFCTVGLAPQDLKYKGEDTETIIGPRTVIREHCSIHRGTVTGSGVTRIGADCLLMAVVHVAHDCEIGDQVVIANNVVMGGHVSIGDNAVIGGGAALHQFVRVGRGAMIGGMVGVPGDVVPFAMVSGERAGWIGGLNVVGLQRRGYTRAQVHKLRAAFRTLFSRGAGVLSQRTVQAEAQHGDDPLVAEVLSFMHNHGKRGLTPARLAGDIAAEG